MEMTAYAHGVPCWVHVTVPDTDAAAAFYGALFGWQVPAGDPQMGGYRNAELNGRLVAGITPRMDAEHPTVWSTFVCVDDAAVTLEAVTAAGGTVIAPAMQVADLGTMGLFADPAGAVLGVWQPGRHLGAGVVNDPGSLVWNELITTDVAAALEFYPRVFGWRAVTHTGAMTYTEWHVADRPIAGMMAMPPTMPADVPPHWGVYFAVADCDAAVARVAELGGAALMAPMDISVGRFCAVRDDQGAAFSVMAMSTTAPA